MSPSASDLVDIVLPRVGGPRSAVAAAIASLKRAPVALGRLGGQIERAPAWPREPLTGAVAFELLEALASHGVDVAAPACCACGERRPIAFLGADGPSCRRCGPQERVPCPARQHLIAVTTRWCAACADVEAVAALVGASVAIGADPALAENLVREVLPSLGQWRTAAKWLSARESLDSDDPGPTSVQRLRRNLAAAGVGSVPRCIGCGNQRALPYQRPGGRLCVSCFLAEGAEACANCGQIRPVV